MAKILIVDADEEKLQIALKLQGYETVGVRLIKDAWAYVREKNVELIILDVELPDGKGIDFCERLKLEGDDTPILFLSSTFTESTIVSAFKSGAEDFIKKPFGLEELKVRINKILKKYHVPQKKMIFGDLLIDPVTRVVQSMDRIVNLGRKEVEILVMLIKRGGDVVTRESILTHLYGDSDLFDRTVDSHVSHLRKKLRNLVGAGIEIHSVYGLGYKIIWKGQ